MTNAIAFNDDGLSTSKPVFSMTAEFQAIGEIDEISSTTRFARMIRNVEYVGDFSFLDKDWLASRKAALPSQ